MTNSMTEQELKDLVNRIDQKLYILNEVTFEKLCELKEEFQILKKHFVPEQYTEIKVTMGEMMEMMEKNYGNLLEVGSKDFKGHNSSIDAKIFKNPLIENEMLKLVEKEKKDDGEVLV